jgi:shikimate kinase
VLIVISGPIASGKSTTSRLLARELGRSGTTAATIDLDVVCDMLEHTTAEERQAGNWIHARRAAAHLARAFLIDGVVVVIVEGDFLRAEDRAAFLGVVRPAKPMFVTLRISFATALRRVQTDPTRTLSRDPAFLRRHFEESEAALRDAPTTDLMLDTESLTADEAVRAIAAWAHLSPPAPEPRDLRAPSAPPPPSSE